MTTLTRDAMIRYLTNGMCVVVFTKVNGEVRSMKATLYGKMIPPEKFPDGSRSYANKEVIRCFDLEKQDWRQFRVDAVIDFITEETFV